MNVIEHLLTLTSFILALGLTTIVTFVATLIHRRDTAVFSLAHALWMATIFLSHVNYWLGAFMFKGAEHSSYPSLAFIVLYPAILYLQSALVVTEPGSSVDMQAHHARQRHVYIGWVVIGVVVFSAYMMWIWRLNPRMELGGLMRMNTILVLAGISAIVVSRNWLQIAVALLYVVAGVLSFMFTSQAFL